MKNISNPRRNAIQQLGLLTTGMFVLPLVSCSEKNANQKDSHKTIPPSPFLITSKETLEPSIMGSNMRTLIHSTQTNKQFSCVEAVLAPKKLPEARTSTTV